MEKLFHIYIDYFVMLPFTLTRDKSGPVRIIGLLWFVFWLPVIASSAPFALILAILLFIKLAWEGEL